MEAERGQRLGQGHKSQSGPEPGVLSVRAALFPHAPPQPIENHSPHWQEGLLYLSRDLWEQLALSQNLHPFMCLFPEVILESRLLPALHPQNFVSAPRQDFLPWLASIFPMLQGCWPSLSPPRTEAPEEPRAVSLGQKMPSKEAEALRF